MGKIINKEVIDYHDFRWCKPCFDDVELFSFMVLEIFQAGLSLGTILKKEIELKNAFDGFDFSLISSYGDEEIKNLMGNSKIVKNLRKIKAVINNARVYVKIRSEFGSFCNYIWSFTDGKVVDHRLSRFDDLPVINEISKKVSQNLKEKGFIFFGPKITYSYLQSIGVFNDHSIDCEFR